MLKGEDMFAAVIKRYQDWIQSEAARAKAIGDEKRVRFLEESWDHVHYLILDEYEKNILQGQEKMKK